MPTKVIVRALRRRAAIAILSGAVFDHQIKLGAGGRAVEAQLGVRGQLGRHLHHDEALPRAAGNWGACSSCTVAMASSACSTPLLRRYTLGDFH